MKEKEEKKSCLLLVRRLVKCVPECKKYYFWIFLFAMAGRVCDMFAPVVLNQGIEMIQDSYRKSCETKMGFVLEQNRFLLTMGTLFLLYIGNSLFYYAEHCSAISYAQKLGYYFRHMIIDKINKIPVSSLDQYSHGELLSRLTNDVDIVCEAFQQAFVTLITSVITIIGCIIIMFRLSVPMTLITLFMLLISAGLTGFVVSLSQKQYIRQRTALGEINGQVEERYAAHKEILLYNMQNKSIAEFQKENRKYRTASIKAGVYEAIINTVVTFIYNMGYVVICIAGGYFVVHGQLKVGIIAAFLLYVNLLNSPMKNITALIGKLQHAFVSLEKVYDLLDWREEQQEEIGFSFQHIRGEIDFEHVTFGYKPDKKILDDVSLHIEAGQTVAIVGPTGSGKTTLINLLMRFYELDSGTIKIDGIDISKIPPGKLRKCFGMVLQDTWLFHGTVQDNICFGDHYEEEEMVAAAKAAYVDKFIEAHEDGYNMDIKEDANNISKGQKQLLTIARAMLAKPPVMILDEATSSVDTRTEVLFQKAMKKLTQKETSLIIAHRLSTIRAADKILVLKNGKFIEQGTHEELMEQKGFYYELVMDQYM